MSILIVLDKAIIDNNHYPKWVESYKNSSLFFMERPKYGKAQCQRGEITLMGSVTIAIDNFDEDLFEFSDGSVKAIIVRPYKENVYECFMVNRVKKDHFILGETLVDKSSRMGKHIDFLISYCSQTSREYTIEEWLKVRDIPEQAAEFKFIDIA